MKKLITAGLVLVGSMIAAQASAATLECYVDTQGYDRYTKNHCFAMIPGQRTATAVFRISGAAKPISSVIWGDKAASCGTRGTSCSFTITGFTTHKASATILYQDGTYESKSGTASFEDGR
ncbi:MULTISPECIES: hypothetical protein [Shewanella]|uniref:hypothetical protein n=1 Tax=Shewanella TaxID=22 RepID=UPI0004B8C6A5|nr:MULTISPECIES: hypothetical protein [Shewanella]QLE84222.1 hypothetical protein FLM48_03455 [Shewanella sp. Scap07]